MINLNTEVVVAGVVINVNYNYYPGCKGSSEYPGGPPIEPDDPGEIEILSITSEEDFLPLTDGDYSQLILTAVEEQHAENMMAHLEAQKENYYDGLREEEMLNQDEK